MLELIVPATELFDESTQTFIQTKETKLYLEHSLVAISKWESKWHKSFINTKQKTFKENVDYIRCMSLNTHVDPNVFLAITQQNWDIIEEYNNDSMTATILPKGEGKVNREPITSEIIYYWMIAYQIPVQFERWHINRLITLIGVCQIKNQPQKKRGIKDVIANHKALNNARRKQFGTGN